MSWGFAPAFPGLQEEQKCHCSFAHSEESGRMSLTTGRNLPLQLKKEKAAPEAGDGGKGSLSGPLRAFCSLSVTGDRSCEVCLHVCKALYNDSTRHI